VDTICVFMIVLSGIVQEYYFKTNKKLLDRVDTEISLGDRANIFVNPKEVLFNPDAFPVSGIFGRINQESKGSFPSALF
jgi:hypothetical protein